MPKVSFKVLWIWLIASLFYTYQYVIRVLPNIMMDDITKKFDIDAAIFGQFSGIYYIGYSLAHLMIGIFLDRFGPKRIMTACILFTSIGVLPIAFSDSWILLLLGRLLVGIGSSAAILGVFKVVRTNFSEKNFASMLSISVTIGLFGAIYGGGPIVNLRANFGSEFVILFLAGLGLALALLTYFSSPESKSVPSASVFKDIKLVACNQRVIAVCVLAGLMVGPLEGFADAWGGDFLTKVYELEKETAGYLCSLTYVGMCFGAPLLSFVATKTNRYWTTIIGSGAIMALVLFGFLTGTFSVPAIGVGCFMLGICSSYQILAIFKASMYVPANVAGLTSALANMIIMIFGYGFHSTIGMLTKFYSHVEPAYAITVGISIIPISLSLAVIGFAVFAGLDQMQSSAESVESV